MQHLKNALLDKEQMVGKTKSYYGSQCPWISQQRKYKPHYLIKARNTTYGSKVVSH